MLRTLARAVGAIAVIAGLLPAAAHAAAVNPPISLTPVDPVGTVLLIHQGGWAGPDRAKQERIMSFPGQVYAARGWRTVSVDYAAGKDGLQSVEDAIGAELVGAGGNGVTGPLCLYGESAGGHLALLAAAHLPSVSCVVAVGAPTDFAGYRDQAAADGNDVAAGTYESLVKGTFGDPGAGTAAWEPAKIAAKINGDVLMVRQGDDQVVPAGQVEALVKALPIVDQLVTAVGDFLDPSQRYLHGTLDEQARQQLADAIGGFADRAVRNARVAAWGRRQGCAQANGAIGRIGEKAFRRSLACLLNAMRARAGRRPVAAAPLVPAGRRIDLRIVGQVTPARVAHRIATRTLLRTPVQRTAVRTIAVRVRQAAESAITLTLG